MRKDGAFLTTSALAEIQGHGIADCLRPSGIKQQTGSPPDYQQGQAPWNQLELLPAFTGWVYPHQRPPATPYLLHLYFQPSGWVPSSSTSRSILPPATALVSPHLAPCCASTPGSPTAASAACRNIVTRLCCFLLYTGTGNR